MKDNKRKLWSDEEINYLTNNYSDMFNYELTKILNRSETSIYVKANKLGLSKSFEHKTKCIVKRNKMVGRNLTKDMILSIAKKFKTKSEFQLKDPSAYSSAIRMGILNEACSHMISKSFSVPQIILKDIISKLYKTNNIIYNDRKTLNPYEIDVYLPEHNMGFEYNGKLWHEKNKNDELKVKLCNEKKIKLIIITEKNRNYEFDIKNQLIDNINLLSIDVKKEDIHNIVIDNPYHSVFDLEDLKKITKSYKSFKEFYKKEYSIYLKISKMGMIDELTKHMCCRRKKRELSEVIERINMYENLSDLINNDKGTYLYVKKNKLNHLLSHLKRLKQR